MDDLQTYFDYNNEQMVELLREIYYPDLLDPFLADAGSVTGESIHFVGDTYDDASTTQNGVSAREAALAETLFFMTKQKDGYGAPAVELVTANALGDIPAGEEFSFDHMIAGLDAHSHEKTGANIVFDPAIGVLGGTPGDIVSDDAVTWLGDLAASVEIALVQESGDETARAAAGYNQEMPIEDFRGDLLGIVAIADAPGHDGPAFEPSGSSMSDHLASFFSSPRFEDRYTIYAEVIADAEVVFDGDRYYVANRGALLDRESHPITNIAALGMGLAAKNHQVVADREQARDLAVINMRTFLDQIEAGLNGEEIPEP